jgi:eukaryotic-like serine/threonine-protein kinase
MQNAKQIEDALFYAALGVEHPTQRKLFLDQACLGSDEMRSAVEDLLQAHAEAEQFFASSHASLRMTGEDIRKIAANGEEDLADPSKLLAEEEAGLQIGRYRLLQKIGEGGCGVVYMAEQREPVRRRVAVKIIKLGMDTKNVIARFEAERQALALMDHPNIARVLDAGATETGRPYFVMELVRGVRVTDYCDDNNLDTRQRLAVFIQICQAIQHAHQKGVIHRDIKPSNVLVTMHDGVPVPKVIDFGIAKAIEAPLTDKTLFTAYDQFIGTPTYVSPEQAELSGLDVDTRSDIYSLGVLLYELLTGKTPFDGQQLMKSGLEVMRRTLREKEPQRPSTMVTTLQGDELRITATHRQIEPFKLVSVLRGDLDWIVMKALEKDRRRRYETANGLAMDIQRHLIHEAVLARPPSRLYLFLKLVRRNRVLFTASAAVAAALVVGLGASTWLYFKERAARQAEARLRAESEQRENITKATMLSNQGKFEEADALVRSMHSIIPSFEATSLFRGLGTWHAIHGRWGLAADRFTMLTQADQVESWDTITGDFLNVAPALLENGDIPGYERFRQGAIARLAGNTDPIFTERTMKTCLLLPADEKTINSLNPLFEAARRSLEDTDSFVDDKWASWRCVSLGLMEYRRGNSAKAVQWCRRCLESHEFNPARAANARVILAMSLYRLGQDNAAQAELEQCREAILTRFQGGLEIGSTPEGFWCDWVFARILLREATGLIGGKQIPVPLTNATRLTTGV